MKKRGLKILLALFISFTNIVSVKATSEEQNINDSIERIVETDNGIEIFLNLEKDEIMELSRSELDAIHEAAIETVTALSFTNRITTYGRPTYYNEYGPTVMKTVGGYAGNQPSGGTRFRTGGGFYYSTSGGPSVSFGVSFAGLGGFFEILSVSVGLGTAGSSGRIVDVPNTTDFFKLYVDRTYSCKPYITYCTDSSGETTVYRKAVSTLHVTDDPLAVKV